MGFDWDNFWVTICLGILAIASAALGAAFFSAGLVNLATTDVSEWSLFWFWCKSVGAVFVVAVYWHMLSRAETAIFATEIELARLGTNRREVVRHIFNGLFFIVFGLLLIVAMNAIEDLVVSLYPESIIST